MGVCPLLREILLWMSFGLLWHSWQSSGSCQEYSCESLHPAHPQSMPFGSSLTHWLARWVLPSARDPPTLQRGSGNTVSRCRSAKYRNTEKKSLFFVASKKNETKPKHIHTTQTNQTKNPKLNLNKQIPPKQTKTKGQNKSPQHIQPGSLLCRAAKAAYWGLC